MIVCVLIPDLVSHVEAQNIEGVKKPVILTTLSGYVQAASLEAAQQGIRVGMRQRQAHALCPDACLLSFDDAPYKAITEAIGDALQEFTSKVELITGFWKRTKKKLPVPAYPSGAIYYLDLGKLKLADALFVVDQIQKTLTALFGLTTCIGLASGKFTAGVAVRFAKSDVPKSVRLGFEARFLARLPINLLPLSKETGRRLQLLGINTIGAFAALPSDAVFNQFGKDGRFLHQLAQGIETRSVATRVPKPKEKFKKILDGAVEDKTVIEALFGIIGCEVEQRLKECNVTTSQLELILYLDDGKTVQTYRVLREATTNNKLIARSLMRLFAPLELLSGITEIQVTASELTTPVMQQLDLFGAPSIVENRITDLLEKLTSRFGNESIYQVSDLEPDHWLPEYRFMFEHAEVA